MEQKFVYAVQLSKLFISCFNVFSDFDFGSNISSYLLYLETGHGDRFQCFSTGRERSKD